MYSTTAKAESAWETRKVELLSSMERGNFGDGFYWEQDNLGELDIDKMAGLIFIPSILNVSTTSSTRFTSM